MKVLITQPMNDDNRIIIEAMGVINPQLCKSLNLRVSVVQGGEGEIPHMHVYHGLTNDLSKCSYIRLDVPEYSEHHDDDVNLKLDKDQKKALIKILTSPWPKHFREMGNGTIRALTGYEAAVDMWVETYEDGDYSKFTLDMNGDPIMPDYSKL